MRRVEVAAMLLVGLLMIGLGIRVVMLESPPPEAKVSRFIQLANQADPVAEAGWSVLMQNTALVNCDSALRGYRSLEMKYAGDAVRDKTVDVCAKLAKGLTDTQPTMSFAWYVGAYAAALQQNWPELNRQLRNSIVSGPYEQWIAEKRAELAEANLVNLDPETQVAHGADLQMLVASRRGIISIVRRYIADADFKDRITGLVEQMPPKAQRYFLFSVKDAYGLYGPRKTARGKTL